MANEEYERIYNGEFFRERQLDTLEDIMVAFFEECEIANNLIMTFEDVYSRCHLQESIELEVSLGECQNDINDITVALKELRQRLKDQYKIGKTKGWVDQERKDLAIQQLKQSDLIIESRKSLIKTISLIDNLKKERNLTLGWMKDRNLLTKEEYESLIV